MRKSQQGFIVPSIGQLAIIALVVALIFGTKKLRAVGGDIGGMFKGIKDGFREARGAADELAPEVQEAINDVKAIHRTGVSFKDAARDAELRTTSPHAVAPYIDLSDDEGR